MNKREAYMQQLADHLVDSAEFVHLCLIERAKFEADREAYRLEDAPELVRDLCEVSLSNVNNGISPTLCHNVEQVIQSVMYRIVRWADLPRDEPMADVVRDWWLEVV